MNISKRRKSRNFLVQALYQMIVRDAELEEILEFFVKQTAEKADEDFFISVLSGIFANKQELITKISVYLDRDFDSLDPITTAVLYIASFELTLSFERIDNAVVIDEAIRLSKTYGSEQGYKLINGVLDKLANG